jgi:hypothetical protein
MDRQVVPTSLICDTNSKESLEVIPEGQTLFFITPQPSPLSSFFHKTPLSAK